MFELGADLELDLCNLDLIWSKDEMMLSGGGHELNQAGQDSLLEQMETSWVNVKQQQTDLILWLENGTRRIRNAGLKQ